MKCFFLKYIFNIYIIMILSNIFKPSVIFLYLPQANYRQEAICNKKKKTKAKKLKWRRWSAAEFREVNNADEHGNWPLAVVGHFWLENHYANSRETMVSFMPDLKRCASLQLDHVVQQLCRLLVNFLFYAWALSEKARQFFGHGWNESNTFASVCECYGRYYELPLITLNVIPCRRYPNSTTSR